MNIIKKKKEDLNKLEKELVKNQTKKKLANESIDKDNKPSNNSEEDGKNKQSKEETKSNPIPKTKIEQSDSKSQKKTNNLLEATKPNKDLSKKEIKDKKVTVHDGFFEEDKTQTVLN
jgi:hypothetical protein